MTLARISLASGRSIELTSLEISSTYGGFLEGYPNAQINDGLLKRLGKRREFVHGSQPACVIQPQRSRSQSEHGSARLPFGPMETLPPVCCQGDFRSKAVGRELDPVLHRSWLVVVWFQEDLASPVDELVTAAVRDLAWDEYAEDYEL